jgi:hypothetical protein
MEKRNGKNTMIYKILQIEKHDPHKKYAGEDRFSGKVSSFFSAQAPVVLLC